MKRVDFGVENPSTSDELSCLEPKQLSFHASTFPSASFTEDAQASPTSAQNDQQGCSPLDSKQQEMKESLTALQVQIVTKKEALQKLNQLENKYMTLSRSQGCVCNNIVMQLAIRRQHATVLLVQILIHVKKQIKTLSTE